MTVGAWFWGAGFLPSTCTDPWGVSYFGQQRALWRTAGSGGKAWQRASSSQSRNGFWRPSDCENVPLLIVLTCPVSSYILPLLRLRCVRLLRVLRITRFFDDLRRPRGQWPWDHDFNLKHLFKKSPAKENTCAVSYERFLEGLRQTSIEKCLNMLELVPLSSALGCKYVYHILYLVGKEIGCLHRVLSEVLHLVPWRR